MRLFGWLLLQLFTIEVAYYSIKHVPKVEPMKDSINVGLRCQDVFAGLSIGYRS